MQVQGARHLPGHKPHAMPSRSLSPVSEQAGYMAQPIKAQSMVQHSDAWPADSMSAQLMQMLR